MKANTSDLKIGTIFTHNNLVFQVTSHEDAYMTCAKCLNTPNPFEHEVAFISQIVDIEDGTILNRREPIIIIEKPF